MHANAVGHLTSQISSISLVEISLLQCTSNGRTVSAYSADRIEIHFRTK